MTESQKSSSKSRPLCYNGNGEWGLGWLLGKGWRLLASSKKLCLSIILFTVLFLWSSLLKPGCEFPTLGRRNWTSQTKVSEPERGQRPGITFSSSTHTHTLQTLTALGLGRVLYLLWEKKKKNRASSSDPKLFRDTMLYTSASEGAPPKACYIKSWWESSKQNTRLALAISSPASFLCLFIYTGITHFLSI